MKLAIFVAMALFATAVAVVCCDGFLGALYGMYMLGLVLVFIASQRLDHPRRELENHHKQQLREPACVNDQWDEVAAMLSVETNHSQPVELVPAFSWACDNCGRDNFARTIVAELSEEEMAELRSEHGIQPWEAGEFLQKPNEVQCSNCQCRFSTVDYRE